MTSIVQLLDAATSHINTTVPNLEQCEVYASQFVSGETTKAFVRAPACFVACTSADTDTDPGTEQLAMDCKMSAVIIARNAYSREARHDDCLALVEAVALAIKFQRFGLADVGVARIAKFTNDYNAVFDDRGFASWTIDWTQKILIGASIWEGTEFLPTTVFLGFVPKVGLAHIADYIQIHPPLP